MIYTHLLLFAIFIIASKSQPNQNKVLCDVYGGDAEYEETIDEENKLRRIKSNGCPNVKYIKYILFK